MAYVLATVEKSATTEVVLAIWLEIEDTDARDEMLFALIMIQTS